jgi:lysophospholipase L1-like esterase
MDCLEALKPDLVLVAFGANDCCHHYLIPEETKLAQVTLAGDIKKRFGADVVLVGSGGDNPLKPFFKDLDETVAAQAQAAAEASVPFVNTRAAILAATDNDNRWAEFHFDADNCHPTDNGHVIWANTALAVINREFIKPAADNQKL